MKVATQLLTPLRYLRIGGGAKWKVDVLVPALLAVFTTVLLVAVRASVLSPVGLVNLVNELLQVLVGFYVASLAAVSTFTNVSLDQPVLGSCLDESEITRRRFLSYLFGYLAVLSLLLYGGGVLAILASTELRALCSQVSFVRPALLFVYVFLCWNLVCVTLLGLHYLVDRIYRADPIVYPKPDGRSTSGTR